MRAILQRVSEAAVVVDGQTVGAVGRGLLVLLGVGREDDESDVRYLAQKTAGLRIFEDEQGRMNRSVSDIGGAVLVVSQFTLYGDCRKGRRPGFSDAAPPQRADSLYGDYVAQLQALGLTVATGIFQADMKVSLVNDGPVTFLLDSKREF